MNKLFVFLTHRLFFFFLLHLRENLWHSLWGMENKSLNPVCVNNWNVFSWSPTYSCYFGPTADGRIVNIPTPLSDRLCVPTFGGNPPTPERVSRTRLSPAPTPFLSCCLHSPLRGPPCSLPPGYILTILLRSPAAFPVTLDMWRGWEQQLLELMSVPLL